MIVLDKEKFPIMSKCQNMTKKEIEEFKTTLTTEEKIKVQEEANTILSVFKDVVEKFKIK